ncbi:MAG: toll/interleukin-1 receptor domain-containing protein [Cyanobacteria bacterium P01_F01_bin.143]
MNNENLLTLKGLQQKAVQKEWLHYAPQVPELEPGKKWHIFLSYRSVNRPWVLNLYDALCQVGFKVFLDQFSLIPGESLIFSLQNALQESASGIIVWSTESEDSEWCKREYESMMRLQSSSEFKFVVVKLANADLPLFAQNSLYEDFSDSPEGPRGSGLLRIMYGLLEQPLQQEAVRFSVKIDQLTKQELEKIYQAKIATDAKKLYELGTEKNLAWLNSYILSCKAVEALIDLEEYDYALDVLMLTDAHFPKSIRAKQLRALALARSGAWLAAQQILGVFYNSGHRDSETISLYARTWMDKYNKTKKRLYLEKSQKLYAEAFKLNPKDYYPGINAASKSVFLGNLEIAQEFASKVEKIVGTKVVSGNYWKTATIAEVQLIRQNYVEAAKLYREAVLIEPDSSGKHQTTLGQARLLMECFDTSATNRDLIEKAFP